MSRERVLDLGSGGGIAVLLSARRVGEAGEVYGLDMTDEMLAAASPVRCRSASTARGWPTPVSSTSRRRPHEVAGGMHSVIIRANKPTTGS